MTVVDMTNDLPMHAIFDGNLAYSQPASQSINDSDLHTQGCRTRDTL
jgi:hypothetical protein